MNRQTAGRFHLVVWVSTGSLHRRGSRYYLRLATGKPKAMNRETAREWLARFEDDCRMGRARLLDSEPGEVEKLRG